ncbi:Piwi domain-containing protein [Massariosphaeria phaeospora]|uniref:Piwi domain-containing protein n=1 Tax=Massariosphaeria phaeospora TaxID=100035 RepID=A0A7C8M713_9PLEO|nr:Piwi domain-containing protein [Massariosphaeria phaeospora]
MQLHTRSVDAELKDWFDACEHNDCTLVLLRSKDYDTYSTIKRMADLDRGMHTLCAVGKKIDPNRDEQKRHQFLANLTLKVNIKIAGDNHYPDQTTLNKLLGNRRNSTIIFGADVAHPGAGAKLGSPSIACVVGSVDEVFMKYPGSMRLQAGGQEQIEPEHLRSMLKERFQAWSAFENKNRLPTSVLFYRDGVSESQFKMCQEDEIPEIEAAYKELGGDTTKLTITFVVVGKRHHTRFYPTNTSQSYEERKKIGNASRMVTNGNLKPGLLVDSVVTNPEPSNFFLQSHCAIQGTARSAHYHILHDGMALGKTILPQLTLLLCCAFSRSTKVVSYVAPAYIADRLCERGRVYLRPWTINSSRGPTWPAPKDTAGKPFTKDRFDSWKKGKAQELANTPGIWGPNYNENPNHPTKSVRLNPWHPNLDQGMFWM